MMKKIKFPWKHAFFLIVFLNLFFIVFIIWPVKDRPTLPNDLPIDEDGPKINLETNKSDLTQIMNHYIDQKYDNQTLKYYVQLGNNLIFYGNLNVFGQDVQLELQFKPEPLENGDLRLKQEKMSIGNLTLPVPIIMNLIARAYQFPEWVEIQPQDGMIYLHLTQIKLENNFRIRVDEFDLKNDKISFQLFINKENN